MLSLYVYFDIQDVRLKSLSLVYFEIVSTIFMQSVWHFIECQNSQKSATYVIFCKASLTVTLDFRYTVIIYFFENH